MYKLIRNAAIALGLAMLATSVAHATPLSAARVTSGKNQGAIKSYLMKASTTIYAGGMVMLNTSGTVEPAAKSATAKEVVGLAVETKTSGSSGSYYVKVEEGWFLLGGTTLGQSNQGALVYVVDDQTVDDAWATNTIVAGFLIEYVGASSGWVYLAPIWLPRDALTGAQADTFTNTVDGKWKMAGVGATNNEDVSFDLETTANTLTLSSGSGVVALDLGAVGTTLKMGSGDTVNDGTAGAFIFKGLGGATNKEDLKLDLETTANTATLSSSTGVVTIDSGAIGYKSSSATPLEFTTTSDIGWAKTTGANTACNTTCVHGCVFGQDTDAATKPVVACSDATADICICAGSN